MKTFNARFLALVVLLGSCDGGTGDADVESNVSALTAAQCDYFDSNGKTQICHATGSAQHPFTIMKVSEAACVQSHAAHAGDYIAVNDPTCQGLGCLPANAPCDPTVPCCDGLSCIAGTCQCPSGQTHCAGACVDTASDQNNCGGCGIVCATGSTCTAGACVVPPSPFTEFSLPTAGCFPYRLAVGSDGNIWFSEPGCNKIGRITVSGEITEFPIPTPGTNVFGVCLGPDGNVWFTEPSTSAIGKITPAGVITEYPDGGFQPYGITAGPDGNLWVGDINGSIRRVTPDGQFTTFLVSAFPAAAYPLEIAAGPDGNLWFTEEVPGNVGRITVAGGITEFPAVASTGPFDTALRAITAGADGNLWFTTGDHNQVGRMSVAGAATLFDLPGPGSQPEDITRGPDGNVWLTEYLNRRIARVAPDGTITEFELPTVPSFPVGIVTGPDGAIWFTEVDALMSGFPEKIGRFQP